MTKLEPYLFLTINKFHEFSLVTVLVWFLLRVCRLDLETAFSSTYCLSARKEEGKDPRAPKEAGAGETF